MQLCREVYRRNVLARQDTRRCAVQGHCCRVAREQKAGKCKEKKKQKEKRNEKEQSVRSSNRAPASFHNADENYNDDDDDLVSTRSPCCLRGWTSILSNVIRTLSATSVLSPYSPYCIRRYPLLSAGNVG